MNMSLYNYIINILNFFLSEYEFLLQNYIVSL